MGERRAPSVSTKNIPLPMGIDRQTEVILLSLFYKQNLLNSFLYLSQRTKCPSPMCVCLAGEQNAFHLLVECEIVDYSLRVSLETQLNSANVISDGESMAADYISLLNCSRDSSFIKNCIEVITVYGDSIQLRKEYMILSN